MKSLKKLRYIGFILVVLPLLITACNTFTPDPINSSDLTLLSVTAEAQLGKSIFFDTDLSIGSFISPSINPPISQKQSCASCHDPEAGWTGPITEINAHGGVYEGSILGRFGNRKPPSSAYATVSPIFHFEVDKKDSLFVGGNFWDGRATGEKLGNPAADQAQGPFLNPLEQALSDSACVVYRVCNPVVPSAYPVTFEDVWGNDACNITWPSDVEAVCKSEGAMVTLSSEDRTKVDVAYDQIALSIAAYEASPESNAFTSKYDYYLQGVADLSKQEKKGLNLFKGKAKCSSCHILDSEDDSPPLFTDFTYDNLGVPRNPENPFYSQVDFNPEGPDWVDEGLGAFLKTRPEYLAFAAENLGKQKVPTLRNVDLRSEPDFVKAYGHNGYFKSLEGIVNFYNTRDVKPVCPDPMTTEADARAEGCWPEPEIPVNVNTSELGDLHLKASQEAAIVAFLKTLSDGYQP